MIINYAEPTAARRRIPVYLVDSTGAPVTGVVPAGAQLQVSKSGAAFANGAGTWAEVGSGLYHYEATLAEVTTDSYAMLKVNVSPTASIFVLAVDIDRRLVTNEASAARRRIPIYLVDSSGVPVTGLAIAGADRQVSENGGAFANGAGTVTETGSGAYYYELAAAEVDVPGFGALKVIKAPALTYVYSWSVYVPGSGAAPTLTNLEPPNGQPVGPDTPIQFDMTDSDGLVLVIPMITLDPFRLPEPAHDFTEFTELYLDGGSTREAISNGYRYTLRRKGGWTTNPQLRVFAVDLLGNVYVGP